MADCAVETQNTGGVIDAALTCEEPTLPVPVLCQTDAGTAEAMVVANDHGQGDNEDDEASKENEAPPSENIKREAAGQPGTPKKRTRSGKISKRELKAVASPKARWLPRTEEKRRGRETSRFEFEEKEAEPLWQGEGRKLEDSELVANNIKFFSRNDTFLKQIHHIFYNRSCKANEVKANLIAFSGLPDYYESRAREKLEAKSTSFLKLLADVLGRPHGEEGKKKSLVDSIMNFLVSPTKVKRGIDLAEKAETLKEQRRAAKEKKEKKEKREKKEKKNKRRRSSTGTKQKTRKAKASDFYSDIESDDDSSDDMAELYNWDKTQLAKTKEQVAEIEKLITEKEEAKKQKKAEKAARKQSKRKAEEDEDDEDSEEERKRKRKQKKKQESKRRILKAKRRKGGKTKRVDEDEDEKDEEQSNQSEIDKSEEESEEDEPATPKRKAKRRRSTGGEAERDEAEPESETKTPESRKRRRIMVDEEDEDDAEDSVKNVDKPATSAHEGEAAMQVEESARQSDQKTEAVPDEQTLKLQENIREVLRKYLKEELTLEEARMQTPKLLRLHVQAVLGHSVDEHMSFILRCVQQLFTSQA